ncbi:MAG TPA: hypothetical protein VK752_03545 [Bryobacteraceae bacterium]|jgi:hypothetical protein|nr:hypothetical protein [Bryobacteraceae bacterium]
MWRRLFMALALANGIQAQRDPVELLRRVQAKVSSSIDRVPRYMCTETIDRRIFQSDRVERGVSCDDGAKRSKHLTTSDRLRMDVGMAPAREMYSWVGENRFDNRELADMVKEGATATGSFAGYLAAIFRGEDASFTYNGETTQDGHARSEFGFKVPYDRSHYSFGMGIHRIVTAYSGTFLVDPTTADLVRLEITTDQLPAESGACHASTTLDYTARVHVAGIDFLLPGQSTLRLLRRDGSVAENGASFSSCHEFLGESEIKYDPPPSDIRVPETRKPESTTFTIPGGLPFRLAFEQGFDTGSAAAGDPVKAKLITPIHDGAKVLAQSGAPVAARIVRMRQFYGYVSSISLDVTLETVEVGGIALPLIAAPDIGVHFEQKKGKGELKQRLELGTLRGLENRSISFVFKDVRFPYLIVSGLESNWVTAAR